MMTLHPQHAIEPHPGPGNAPTSIADLQTLPNWVVFALEPQPGDGKPKKLPYTPGTQDLARVNDPGTWRTHAEAVADAKRASRAPAVTLAPGMGLTAIDWDDCIGPDGTISPEATRLIATLDSYTERSISGNGIHILVQGRPPDGFVAPAGVEVYPREGNRFLLLTQTLIDGRDMIQDRAELLATLFPPAAPTAAPPSTPLTLDDQDIIQRARSAENGHTFAALFDQGDDSAYGGDKSRADLALCSVLSFWTQDAAQIARIFCQSALMRPKWERTDYQRATIRKALQRAEVYDPGRVLPASHPPALNLDPCEQRVADLERQLAEAHATITTQATTIATQAATIDTLRQTQSDQARIQANASLGKARSTAAVIANRVAWRATASDTPPGEQGIDVPPGMMALSVKEIAAADGVSENTASSRLKALEESGLIQRQIKKVATLWDAETGERLPEPVWITKHFIGPAGALAITPDVAVTFSRNLAGFTTERTETRGGKRIPRCPDHPEAGVVRDYIDRCGHPGCRRQLNQDSVPLPDMLLEPVSESITSFGDHSEPKDKAVALVPLSTNFVIHTQDQRRAQAAADLEARERDRLGDAPALAGSVPALPACPTPGRCQQTGGCAHVQATGTCLLAQPQAPPLFPLDALAPPGRSHHFSAD